MPRRVRAKMRREVGGFKSGFILLQDLETLQISNPRTPPISFEAWFVKVAGAVLPLSVAAFSNYDPFG